MGTDEEARESGTDRRSRVNDRGPFAALWGRYGRDFTTVFAVGLAAYAVFVSTNVASDAKSASSDAKRASIAALRAANSSRKAVKGNAIAIRQIQSESKERINETCRINETKQSADIKQLKQLYSYLAGLSPAELRQPLNRTILASVPQSVHEAQLDDAAKYCDAPGVGLPEPDLKLPKPPKGLRLPTAGSSRR